MFYFVSEVLCICTAGDRRISFGMTYIYFFFFTLMILFFFHLIVSLGIGIASRSMLEVLKDDWTIVFNIFYFFV
jgi:hypothetical protein